ncbi:MAG: type IV pilus modification protein PilV [Comamonadaceae bacterium]|nr:type IV pilus modification protein PilV [Comamonadaceae bacterium]
MHAFVSKPLPAAPGARIQARGFSLVEVLISIVILSFGLLGAVGLQAAALKNNRDARLQSEGTNLARELAEMMRANARVAGAAGTTNPYRGSFGPGQLTPATSSDCLNLGKQCDSPQDVANAQMTEWLARVQHILPGARVVICLDSQPYDKNGLPRWDCTSANTAQQNITVIKLGWTRATGQNQLEAAGAEGSRPHVLIPVTPGGQL